MKPLSVSCPEVPIEGCPLVILLSIDSGNRSVDQGLQRSLGACPCMLASTLVRFAVTVTDVDVDVRELVYGAYVIEAHCHGLRNGFSSSAMFAFLCGVLGGMCFQ